MRLTKTAADPTATCPECAAPRMVGHPAGVLTFQHGMACSILTAEDATKAADFDRLDVAPAGFQRQATPAETRLLSTVGVPLPAATSPTIVRPVTQGHGVIRRDWAHVATDETAAEWAREAARDE